MTHTTRFDNEENETYEHYEKQVGKNFIEVNVDKYGTHIRVNGDSRNAKINLTPAQAEAYLRSLGVDKV